MTYSIYKVENGKKVHKGTYPFCTIFKVAENEIKGKHLVRVSGLKPRVGGVVYLGNITSYYRTSLVQEVLEDSIPRKAYHFKTLNSEYWIEKNG